MRRVESDGQAPEGSTGPSGWPLAFVTGGGLTCVNACERRGVTRDPRNSQTFRIWLDSAARHRSLRGVAVVGPNAHAL